MTRDATKVLSYFAREIYLAGGMANTNGCEPGEVIRIEGKESHGGVVRPLSAELQAVVPRLNKAQFGGVKCRSVKQSFPNVKVI